MNEKNQNFVIIGQFGKPHGISGFLKIHSSTHPPEKIFSYQPWYVLTKTDWELGEIDETKSHDQLLTAHIKNINNPETAKVFTNKKIAVPREKLPILKSKAYYWHDLIGMIVINENRVELGKVDYLFETHANDVMVVLGNKRHLIPFIKNQIIREIDLNNKIILVNWDENF